MLRVLGCLLAGFLVSSCAGTTGGSGLPAASTAAASRTEESSTETSGINAELVGTWTRTQGCETMLAAFEEAGLAESHAEWIVGNWVGDPAEVEWDPDDVCADARPAEEHSHFFTEDGQFGSYDAEGDQVDSGDYAAVDTDTLSFPSHSAEFGYDGDILVDYAVSGDSATFGVQLPTECHDACLEAHAWALSAFYGPDPWIRSDR
jgi:hypothetical protein